MKKQIEQFLRRRKLFLALPILAMPFVTVIFYALGGGQGSSAQAMPTSTTGLNVLLPTAHFENSEASDKLSLYEKAKQDSAKFKEARESDPYFDLISFENAKASSNDSTTESNLIDSFRQRQRSPIDANEEKVNRKLEELYKEINKNSNQTTPFVDQKEEPAQDSQFGEDVDRLEQLMLSMNEQRQADPEMDQIGSMLDKILDIQHPQRVTERMSAPAMAREPQNSSSQVTKTSELITLLNDEKAIEKRSDTALLVPSKQSRVNDFYGLGDTAASPTTGQSIAAVVHDTQELVNGSTIKLRITEQIKINSHSIKKDQIIFGTCNINGDRLTIKINSILIEGSIVPIALSAYDIDGIQGLYIPGTILRDQAKDASANSLQNMQMMSINPSLSAQIANAGVEAAKGLFSKKAKLIKVTVKAGYKIFLQQAA